MSRMDPAPPPTAGPRRGLRRVAASIRTRLLATVVLVLVVAIAGTALGTRLVLLARVDERIDEQLAQQAEELREFAEDSLDPATGEPFGTDAERLLSVFIQRTVPTSGQVIVTYVDGQPAQRTAQRVPYRVDTDPELTAMWAGLTTTKRGMVETEGGPFEYLAVPVGPEGEPQAVFLVGVFRDVVAGEVDQTVRVTALVAVMSLGVAIVMAAGLARRILTPLEEVTTAAREITESDLSRRLDESGHDEVAELSHTFNGMLDRLESAFATQRAFVDDAGHELRTPITVIRGHLEVLDDADPAERAATRELVLDELDRMHRIVEDLLTLAKAEQPDFVMPSPLDLDELTTRVHQKSQALSTVHTWELDDVGFGRLEADGQRITQALVQLADNAVQHTPPGTTIGIGSALSAHDDGTAQARLWVRDEGPGIALGEQQRIFERFARGGDGPRRSDGAGLGLSIVRAIAEAHGGHVTLASLPGQGAVFTLHLPVASAPPAPPPDVVVDDLDHVTTSSPAPEAHTR